MKKYWVVFKLGWQDAIVYRSEFFLGMLGWIVRLAIAIFIWNAVFSGKEVIGNYDFTQIVSYFFMMTVATSFIFSRIGFWVGEDIHTGDFANYLIKPVSYTAYRIINEFGQNLLRLLVGSISIIIPSLIFFPQFLPSLSIIDILPIIIVLILGFLINSYVTLIIGLTGFWVVNSNRLMYVYFAIITAISGINIPIDLFPEAAMKILDVLPFSYIFYYPIKIMINGYSPELFTKILIGQSIYLILFILITKIIMHLGTKKFEAVGR